MASNAPGIFTKAQMYAFFESGAFGNKTRSWRVLSDYFRSGFTNKVALRYVERPGGPCVYDLSSAQVERTVFDWQSEGYKREHIHVSECLNPQKILLAGEVMRSERFFDLTYYDVPGFHMRPGLAHHSKTDTGLSAYLRMKCSLDGPSWENLQDLFDRYPDSIIEFSCCSYSFGELNWNTAFWEVRNY